MSYEEGFERLDIDEDLMTEAQKIIIKGFMLEGEFRFRENLINVIQKEISTYLDEVDYEPNMDWVNGLSWCIHLIKNMKPDQA